MKLMGLYIEESAKALEITRQNPSTKYENRGLLEGNLKEKICFLRRAIHTEITVTSPYLLSLEEIAERYYDDSLLAKADSEMAWFIQYQKAHERCKVLINNGYNMLPPIFV